VLWDKELVYIEKGDKEMAEKAKDPVCGMDIDPDRAAGKSEYGGQTYYFCSTGCKRTFDKEPEKYIPIINNPGSQLDS
jgi:YHS domain-containing protein